MEHQKVNTLYLYLYQMSDEKLVQGFWLVNREQSWTGAHPLHGCSLRGEQG